ncbi:MAG: M43 family zinc metalloprotease [Bacteroidota bacterium]
MKKILLLVSFLFLLQELLSQDHQHDSWQKDCGTMEQDSINRLRNPQMGSLDQWEQQLQKRISEIELMRQQGRLQEEVLTIPVIVHIIHNGEPVGEGTNLSEEQVRGQLEVLNEDFRREPGTPGFNDDPRGADIEIEFCLSEFDENGNQMEEPGINRYRGQKTLWTRDEIEGVLKPSTFWDPDKYFNIWVVNFTPQEGLAGYAQFPSSSNLAGMPSNGGLRSTDGVVVWYRVFGSRDKGDFDLAAPSDRGRTLTHEVGHWLGLRHVWGDGPCSADDFCDDTNPSSGPNRGCPSSFTCDSPDEVANYMNYTDDACMNMFTQCQKTRMRAVMDISPRRGSLLSSNVCSPEVAAAPRANFTANRRQGLRGGRVQFNDLSANFPNSWRWIFEGGEPEASTDRNPEVIYSESGAYDVQLIAENDFGSDTLLVENFIEILPQGVCADTSNFGSGTPIVYTLADSANQSGYVAGHNTLLHQAKAEFFDNALGYEFISGVNIRFGAVKIKNPDALVTVTVWNARGAQGAPGSILEEVEVPLAQIEQDINASKATEVVFSRTTPLFGQPYFVGIQLDYQGDSVAIVTTRDGETLFNSAWEQDAKGEWESYALTWPLNISHDIEPVIGMNPSVQVSASENLIIPGQSVVLQAKGASVFQWLTAEGTVLGPQITVNPTQTTTYQLVGSGLELCRDTVDYTVFVKSITSTDNLLFQQLQVYPNPADEQVKISMVNNYRGEVVVQVINTIGKLMYESSFEKLQEELDQQINISNLSPGVYILNINLQDTTEQRKLIIE